MMWMPSDSRASRVVRVVTVSSLNCCPRSCVDTALRFALSRPAASAWVFAGRHFSGARRTADARVTLRNQRVAGKIVGLLVVFYVLVVPQGEWVDFHQAVL